MPRHHRTVTRTGLILVLTSMAAQASPPGDRSSEVTLKGNVLCNRATEPRPWSWDPGTATIPRSSTRSRGPRDRRAGPAGSCRPTRIGAWASRTP